MKVNENAALIPPNSGVGKTNPGSNSTTVNPGANKVATDVVAGPAVQSDLKTTKVTDEALIEKLRNQVANGEFKIDYKQISQAMLKDVVAAIGQKPKQV
jgi:anti-sigma28 factor (negative regulator of flagellin synthesis)